MSENIEFPSVLYVSGAPLLLAGFNGEYHFCGDVKNPKWSNPVHIFKGIVIRPTVIEKSGVHWILRAQDGYGESFDRSVITQTPVGSWDCWAQVSDRHRPVAEFYHSYGKKILHSCICIGATQFILCNFFPSGTGVLGCLATLAAGVAGALVF